MRGILTWASFKNIFILYIHGVLIKNKWRQTVLGRDIHQAIQGDLIKDRQMKDIWQILLDNSQRDQLNISEIIHKDLTYKLDDLKDSTIDQIGQMCLIVEGCFSDDDNTASTDNSGNNFGGSVERFMPCQHSKILSCWLVKSNSLMLPMMKIIVVIELCLKTWNKTIKGETLRVVVVMKDYIIRYLVTTMRCDWVYLLSSMIVSLVTWLWMMWIEGIPWIYMFICS